MKTFTIGKRRELPQQPASPEYDEVLAAALDESSRSWTKRESDWTTPPTPDCPKEIRISSIGDEVSVEATLAAWDEITPASHEALAEFLRRAEAGVRFAHMQLKESSAVVVSRIEGTRIEADLHHGIGSVSAACRMFGRNAQALLQDDLAQAFLKHQRRKRFRRTPPRNHEQANSPTRVSGGDEPVVLRHLQQGRDSN